MRSVQTSGWRTVHLHRPRTKGSSIRCCVNLRHARHPLRSPRSLTCANRSTSCSQAGASARQCSAAQPCKAVASQQSIHPPSTHPRPTCGRACRPAAGSSRRVDDLAHLALAVGHNLGVHALPKHLQGRIRGRTQAFEQQRSLFGKSLASWGSPSCSCSSLLRL